MVRVRLMLVLAVVLLMVGVVPVAAQDGSVADDLVVYANDGNALDLVVLDGWVYFGGSTPATGFELWRTDGATFELVADIVPGSGSSWPEEFEVLAGWIYFDAYHPDSGWELWRTDGITTELVADINPGTGSGNAWFLEASGEWLFFSATTPEAGYQLWRSDGTTTEMVADIFPGHRTRGPQFLEAFDGWVYFNASDPEVGNELYRSNGTTTELFAEINTSSQYSYPSCLTASGGWLYFDAYAADTGSGFDLWRTNGSDTTQPYGGINIDGVCGMAELDGWMYSAHNTSELGIELWRTDGATTELVADINSDNAADPCTSWPCRHSNPQGLTVMGGWVYFDAYSPETGFELWRSNGTTTELVADINPGTGYGLPKWLFGWSDSGAYTQFLHELDGWLYFGAYTPDDGWRLWRTNGTTTERVGQKSPAVLMGQLVDQVKSLNLANGISNSLDAKLTNAVKALDDVNDNNNLSAINKLEAFINEVQAQANNQIPQADADALITAAQQIINLLNTG